MSISTSSWQAKLLGMFPAVVLDQTTPNSAGGVNVWTVVGPVQAPVIYQQIELTGAYGNGDPFPSPMTVLTDGTVTSSTRPASTDTFEARVVGGVLEVRSDNGTTGFSQFTATASL